MSAFSQVDTVLVTFNYKSNSCNGALPTVTNINLLGETGNNIDNLVVSYSGGSPVGSTTSSNGFILWDGVLVSGSYSTLNIILPRDSQYVLETRVDDLCSFGTFPGRTVAQAIHGDQQGSESGSSQDTIIAVNGMHEVNDSIKWGGDLIEDTEITGNGFDINFTMDNGANTLLNLWDEDKHRAEYSTPTQNTLYSQTKFSTYLKTTIVGSTSTDVEVRHNGLVTGSLNTATGELGKLNNFYNSVQMDAYDGVSKNGSVVVTPLEVAIAADAGHIFLNGTERNETDSINIDYYVQKGDNTLVLYGDSITIDLDSFPEDGQIIKIGNADSFTKTVQSDKGLIIEIPEGKLYEFQYSKRFQNWFVHSPGEEYSPAYLRASAFGVVGDTLTDNRANLQNAIDVAANSNVGIIIDVCGVVSITKAAIPNPSLPSNDYCLTLPGNTNLIVPPCVTIQLADAQQATRPIDLIIMDSVDNVRIGGGGKILGNTAGQTGWAGGYAQITNGCGIRSFGLINTNIIISDLDISDLFSNPIEVVNVTTLRIEEIRSTGVGEGIEIQYCTDVYMHNIYLDDNTDVTVGDGIELASSFNVILDGFIVKNNGEGTAVDAFGGTNYIITNGLVDGWKAGIGINDNSLNDQPVNFIVSNVHVKNTPDPGGAFQISGNVVDLQLMNCSADSGEIGFQFYGEVGLPLAGNIRMKNCEAIGNANHGLIISHALNSIKINGCEFSDNGGSGIMWNGQIQGTVEADNYFEITNTTCNRNAVLGLYLQDNAGAISPHGTIDILAQGNGGLGGAQYSVCQVVNTFSDALDLFITNRNPVRRDFFSNNLQHIAGTKVLYATAGFNNLEGGTDGQVLEIRYSSGASFNIDVTGNINTVGGALFSMDTAGDMMKVRYDAASLSWYEVDRAKF